MSCMGWNKGGSRLCSNVYAMYDLCLVTSATAMDMASSRHWHVAKDYG